MAQLIGARRVSQFTQFCTLMVSVCCLAVGAELLAAEVLASEGVAPAPEAALMSHPNRPKIVVPMVAPWGFFSDSNVPSGLLIDFQQELFKRADLEVSAELRPYPRVVHDLASGSSDMGVMFASPMAEQLGKSLGHVVTMRVILIAPAHRKQAIANLEDLTGERVGFIRGSKYGRKFDEHPDFEHIPVTGVEQGLRMLVTGRLDAMAATEQALLYGMYMSGIPAAEFVIHLTLGNARADLYVSRHREHESWVPKVSAALKTMNLDGTSTKIFYQHSFWPRQAYCFSGGRCLKAVEPPSESL